MESPDPEAQVQGCGLATLPAARSPIPYPIPAPSMHPLTQRGSSPKVQQAHWLSLPPVIGRLHPCSPSTPGPQCASEHLVVPASQHSWWVALVLSSGGWALSQSSVPATQTDVGKPIRELCPLEGWDSAAHTGTHPRGAGSRQALVPSQHPCQRGGVSAGLLLLVPRLLSPSSRRQ